MRFAVLSSGTIQVRALPTREAAQRVKVQQYPHGKVIVDPRSVQR
jgi:hypothetical protein